MKSKIESAAIKMKKNDQAGFDQLFDMFHHKLYFFCIKNGLASEDAKEIVQDVFVKLWSSRSRIDPSGNVQSYIYTIAKNVMLDEFKRRIKKKAAEDYQIHMIYAENATQDKIAVDELQNMVSQVLKNLPDKRRIVFEMSRYQNLTNKEIAAEMGISVKTVEAHITLVLQHFREVFKRSEIIVLSCLMFSQILH